MEGSIASIQNHILVSTFTTIISNATIDGSAGRALLVIELCLAQPLTDGRRKAVKHMIPPTGHRDEFPNTDLVLLVCLTKKDDIWSFRTAELWGIDYWSTVRLQKETLLLDSWSSPCKCPQNKEKDEELLDRNFGTARKQWVRTPGYPSLKRPEFIVSMSPEHLALSHQRHAGDAAAKNNAATRLSELSKAGVEAPEDLGVDLRPLVSKSADLTPPPSSSTAPVLPPEEDSEANPSPKIIQAESWEYALKHPSYQWYFVDKSNGENKVKGAGAILRLLGKIDKKVRGFGLCLSCFYAD